MTLYGSLTITILCLFMPTLIERVIRKDEQWSWLRTFIAYGLITALVIIVPVLTSAEHYILLIMLVVAVAVSAVIAPLTYLGISIVLLLSTVVLPILILWDITRYQGIKEPMIFVLKAMKWHEMAIPVVLGLMTLLLTRNVLQRLRNRKELN